MPDEFPTFQATDDQAEVMRLFNEAVGKIVSDFVDNLEAHGMTESEACAAVIVETLEVGLGMAATSIRANSGYDHTDLNVYMPFIRVAFENMLQFLETIPLQETVQ